MMETARDTFKAQLEATAGRASIPIPVLGLLLFRRAARFCVRGHTVFLASFVLTTRGRDAAIRRDEALRVASNCMISSA
jgi:hypothetical protein